MINSTDSVRLVFWGTLVDLMFNANIKLSGVLLGLHYIYVSRYFVSRIDFERRLNVKDCLFPVCLLLVGRG